MKMERQNVNRILGNQHIEKKSANFSHSSIENIDHRKFLKIMAFLGIAVTAIPNLKGIDEFANSRC